MKKNALMLMLILPVLLVLLFSCKEAQETINIIDGLNEMPDKDYSHFAYYTDYLAIPEFLSKEQSALYKKAAVLHYIFTCEPSEIDSIPLLEGQETLETQEQTIEGRLYYKSVGRYRKYADFEEICLSVFTREFFEKLNSDKKFIEENGDLYITAETEIVQMILSYAPWHESDKFELINLSDTEIKFTATGYYFDAVAERDAPNDTEDNELTHLIIDIILTQTENGWRFSQFATAGNPFNIINK